MGILQLLLVLVLLCGGSVLVTLVNWFMGRSESPIDTDAIGPCILIELIVVLVLEYLFKMDNIVLEILIATVVGAGISVWDDMSARKKTAASAPKKPEAGYYHGDVRELISQNVAPSMLIAAANKIDNWYFEIKEAGMYTAFNPSSYESATFTKTADFSEILSPSGIEDLTKKLCDRLKWIVDTSYKVDGLSRQPVCEILPGHPSVISLRCWDLNADDFDKLNDAMRV